MFGKYISILVQVENKDYIFYTIGERFPIEVENKTDFINYIDYLKNKWEQLDKNSYDPNLAIAIHINWTSTDKTNYLIKQSKIKLNSYVKLRDFSNLAPLNLPLNTKYPTWGKLVTEIVNPNTYKLINSYSDLKRKLNRVLEVSILSDIDREVKIFAGDSGIKTGSFLDKFINKTNEHFIRIVNNTTYHIKDGKLFFIYERLFPKEFITKLRKNKKFSLDIMTLDIETSLDSNNKMNIYCVSFYDGTKPRSFYLTDYPSIDNLIKDLLDNIFSKIYSGKEIYIHNSSNFDLIFLYKYIINYPNLNITPIIKDGKFINLEIYFGGTGYMYKVNFKDSLLLLPNSLDKLGKSFNVKNQKDIFPHKFVNKNTLNYVGSVPSIDYFINLSEDKYNEYVSRFNNNWSLKNEVIKYCEQDCIALYQVISNFGSEFFKEFSVNISTTPTLPSASSRVYRTSFIS